MSINNIQLDASLLSSMYRNSLVEITELEKGPGLTSLDSPKLASPAKNPGTLNTADEGWKFLGENRKNILFVVHYPESRYLPDAQLNFLTSILSACKLSLADIALLNLGRLPGTGYKATMERFQATVTVLLGITPPEFEMPVDFPEFQVQRLGNSSFLSVPGLETLESDKVLKSKLWVCLRKIFGI